MLANSDVTKCDGLTDRVQEQSLDASDSVAHCSSVGARRDQRFPCHNGRVCTSEYPSLS
jgi:hypothetical protein